ncbi:hypothetical protein PR048_018576 [Dryococelus australis]|uniref:Uncharacterized protein n=1 Tax=Dryococelus australis TaxID=614101 RepID=A0ABQ9HCQ4_9NEOP|nr:hypothetical protein PR048_018576 [Dryococelus australis]
MYDMLDTEIFICEVEKRPPAYNSALKEYSNIEVKAACWAVIIRKCSLLGGNKKYHKNGFGHFAIGAYQFLLPSVKGSAQTSPNIRLAMEGDVDRGEDLRETPDQPGDSHAQECQHGTSPTSLREMDVSPPMRQCRDLRRQHCQETRQREPFRIVS